MRLPSKITTYRESVLACLPPILTELRKGPVPALALYKRVKQSVGDLERFIDALDCLFALGEIEIDEESGGIIHAR